MARSNCVGWLGRAQFEERWMQLLGVVNQPPPVEVSASKSVQDVHSVAHGAYELL